MIKTIIETYDKKGRLRERITTIEDNEELEDYDYDEYVSDLLEEIDKEEENKASTKRNRGLVMSDDYIRAEDFATGGWIEHGKLHIN